MLFHNLYRARVCRARRPRELRAECAGCVSTACSLCRSHSQGREARRPAGGAVDQARPRHQPADGSCAQHRGAARRTLHRRRGDRMKRREFITLLGGAAAWPLAVGAQQTVKLPTIGFLGSATPLVESQRVAAFVQRLRELGWIEGRTITIEYRWAEGRNERYTEAA